jgi:hypothetical protein
MAAPLNNCSDEALAQILLRGYIGTYWMDLSGLRLVSKQFNRVFISLAGYLDARCLVVTGRSVESSLASRLFSVVPKMPSLEWLELDYCTPMVMSSEKSQSEKSEDLQPGEKAFMASCANLEEKWQWMQLLCLGLRGVLVSDNDALVIGTCCPALEVLDVSLARRTEGALTDTGGVHLGKCTNLTFLDLSMTGIGDETVRAVCESGAELTSLGLGGCSALTAASLRKVSETQRGSLAVLDISNLECIDDSALVQFASNSSGGSGGSSQPQWSRLMVVMASYLSNVKDTASVTALLTITTSSSSPESSSSSSVGGRLLALDFRGFRGGNGLVHEDAYKLAAEHNVSCLFSHADLSRELTGCAVVGLSMWPPSMAAFRPHYHYR